MSIAGSVHRFVKGTNKKIDIQDRYVQGPGSMVGTGLNPTPYVPGVENDVSEIRNKVKMLYPKLSPDSATAIDAAFKDHLQEMASVQGRFLKLLYAKFSPWKKQFFDIYNQKGQAAVQDMAAHLLMEPSNNFSGTIEKIANQVRVESHWKRTVVSIAKAIARVSKTAPPEVRQALHSSVLILKDIAETDYPKYFHSYYSLPAVKMVFTSGVNTQFSLDEFLASLNFFKK